MQQKKIKESLLSREKVVDPISGGTITISNISSLASNVSSSSGLSPSTSSISSQNTNQSEEVVNARVQYRFTGVKGFATSKISNSIESSYKSKPNYNFDSAKGVTVRTGGN